MSVRTATTGAAGPQPLVTTQQQGPCDEATIKAAMDAYRKQFDEIQSGFRSWADQCQQQSQVIWQKLKMEDNTLHYCEKQRLWCERAGWQMKYDQVIPPRVLGAFYEGVALMGVWGIGQVLHAAGDG